MDKIGSAEVKKRFTKSLCNFMQEAIAKNSNGKYPKDCGIVKMSPRGASIICNLPADFFQNLEIDPTTIEIKFTIK